MTIVGPVQLALTAWRTVPGYMTVTGVLLAVVTTIVGPTQLAFNSRANRTRLCDSSRGPTCSGGALGACREVIFPPLPHPVLMGVMLVQLKILLSGRGGLPEKS